MPIPFFAYVVAPVSQARVFISCQVVMPTRGGVELGVEPPPVIMEVSKWKAGFPPPAVEKVFETTAPNQVPPFPEFDALN